MITTKITSCAREKNTKLLVKTSAPRENYSRFMKGGSNGDGDESGGTSPSRQGAGTGTLSPRNLMAMAAEIGIASGEKGSAIRVPSAGEKEGQRGAPGGPQGSQEGAWRGLGWGRARDPSGVPVVALPSFLGDSGSFRDADFLYNFSRIFGALLMAGKPEIQK